MTDADSPRSNFIRDTILADNASGSPQTVSLGGTQRMHSAISRVAIW